MSRLALTSSPLIKRLLFSRWPQWSVLLIMLAGFLFAILAGWIGTPVGNHNFSIVFIWIAWWAVLILVAVPFFGRAWCAICPIPLPGEWLQRGRVTGPDASTRLPSRRRWPRALRNMWLQNLSFTLVALFSSVILTDPAVTSIILAAMLFLGVGLSMTFERRSFCRYVCPVGGFIGLYAQAAPLELRIQDKAACRTCATKPCYNGSASAYGCPWDVFPGGLEKNTYCGLCMECLRSCPKDNIQVNLRPFAADLEKPAARLDESFKAFIMLGSAMIYAGVLLGPWGSLKQAAYAIGSPAWLAYAASFALLLFVVLPGLYLLAVKAGMWIAKANIPLKRTFSELASALIPLGMAFWAAFSLSFVLANASYILMGLSDPFGWGWDLFGTASISWQPALSALVPPLQSLVLVGGLIWSANTAYKLARRAGLAPAPVITFLTLATTLMAWLLI